MTGGSLWHRHWVLGTMLTRLIIVNIIVWLTVVALSIIAKFFITALKPLTEGTFFLATYADVNILLRRPWTIITHMFTHTGLFHILFNMLILFWFGSIFQGHFGQRRLLSTYLMGGLVGFLAFFLLYNGSGALDARGVSAQGASAAVMAILVATATYFPDMTLRLFLFGDVKLKYIALVYVVIDFVGLNGAANVGGHAGHLGGAIYGFFYIRLLRKGTDINAWMEAVIHYFAPLFTGQRPKMKVAHKKKNPSAGSRKSDEEYNSEKLKKQAQIDRILDKISQSAYDSLTKDEKDFLFRNSKDY